MGSKGHSAQNTTGGFRPDPGGAGSRFREGAAAPGQHSSTKAQPCHLPCTNQAVPFDPSWRPAPRISSEVYRGRPARPSPALLVLEVALKKEQYLLEV